MGKRPLPQKKKVNVFNVIQKNRKASRSDDTLDTDSTESEHGAFFAPGAYKQLFSRIYLEFDSAVKACSQIYQNMTDEEIKKVYIEEDKNGSSNVSQ